MPRITYHDHTGCAFRVTAWGIEFTHGVPVEVDMVPAKARTNPFFTIDDGPSENNPGGESGSAINPPAAAPTMSEKDALWGALDAKGIKYDKRLGIDKLKELLEQFGGPAGDGEPS